MVYIVADSFGVCCASIPAVGHNRAGHSKASGGVKWQDQWAPHFHLYPHIAAIR